MEGFLYNYIKIDLDTCENLLIATNKRASRVARIVEHQMKLKEQTEEDMENEIKQMQIDIFKDHLGLNDEHEFKLHELLYKDDKESKIVYSNKVTKMNRWDEKKETIFVISNYGQIDLLSDDKEYYHLRHQVKLDDLKSLTWIIDDASLVSTEISINSKTKNDYRVECGNQAEKD